MPYPAVAELIDALSNKLFCPIRRKWLSSMAGRPTTEIDRLVGQRIFRFRRAAGVTQKEAAVTLDVTAAQYQKYEHGQNRISAGMLHVLARRLGVPVGCFFDDDTAPPDVMEIELIAAFRAMDADRRKSLLQAATSALARDIAAASQSPSDPDASTNSRDVDR